MVFVPVGNGNNIRVNVKNTATFDEGIDKDLF
jgi:hypothetical protein